MKRSESPDANENDPMKVLHRGKHKHLSREQQAVRPEGNRPQVRRMAAFGFGAAGMAAHGSRTRGRPSNRQSWRRGWSKKILAPCASVMRIGPTLAAEHLARGFSVQPWRRCGS